MVFQSISEHSIGGYCPHCKRNTSIIMKVKRNSVVCDIENPHCEECGTILKEYKDEFFHSWYTRLGVVDIKITDSQKAFNTKNVYDYAKLPVIAISGIAIWSIIIVIIYFIDPGFTGTNSGLIFLLLMIGIPVFLLIINVSIILNEKVKANKMFSYIKENGKHYQGTVTKVVYFHDSGSKRQFYMEIKYYDSNNVENIFMSPMISKIPKKENITCDVYVIDKLPDIYINSRLARKDYVDNFQ